MHKTVNFETHFYKEDLFLKFKIKQNDRLTMQITIPDAPDYFRPEEETARLLLRRSDGTVVYEEIKVTGEGGKVRVSAPSGATAVAGITYGELEFSRSEREVGTTFIFVYEVVARAGDINEAIESKDEIFIIEEIREFLEQAKQDLINIDEDIQGLQAEQLELDSKMQETTAKVEELKAVVEEKDLNVAELKAENLKATDNIEALKGVNSTVEEAKILNQELGEKNETATRSISTITPLIEQLEELKMSLQEEQVSGNIVVSELRDLIEEARQIVIPALKDYIVQNGGSITDLTGVIEKLEELNGIVEGLKTDVEGLKGKDAEIDLIIEEIKEENLSLKDDVSKIKEEILNLDKIGFVGENPVPVHVLEYEDNPAAFNRIKMHDDELDKDIVIELLTEANKFTLNEQHLPEFYRLYWANANQREVMTAKAWSGSQWEDITKSGSTVSVSYKIKADRPSIMDAIYEITFPLSSSSASITEKELLKDVVGDFDGATKLRKYKVSVKDNNVLNSPLSDCEGLLFVDKFEDDILQTLKVDNFEYRRTYKGSKWGSWIQAGGASIEPDDYYTKTETDDKINELVGIPKSGIIKEINEIIAML